MGIYSFFSLSDNFDDRLHKIICLACWVAGGILYIFSLVDSILWSLTFPGFSMMTIATWLGHLGLRIFSMWMPMSFLLIQYRMRECTSTLYVAGGLLAVASSLTSALLLIHYKSFTDLRDEYYYPVKPQIRNGEFPPALTRAVTIDGCCSWYGPSDFVDIYDISKHTNKNLDFMEAVAHCCGDTFAVSKSARGAMKYSNGDMNNKKGSHIPTDCASIIQTRANRIAIFLIVAAVIVCCFTPVLFYFHFANYKRLGLGSTSDDEIIEAEGKTSEGDAGPEDATSQFSQTAIS